MGKFVLENGPLTSFKDGDVKNRYVNVDPGGSLQLMFFRSQQLLLTAKRHDFAQQKWSSTKQQLM